MSKCYKQFPSLFSVLVGILISWVLSHPSSPAKKRLPSKSARNVHYFPNLKIHRETHYYHIHHWMYFGALFLLIVSIRKRFRGDRIIEGFFLGLILQGLTYKDRFKVKFTPEIVVS